MNKEESTPSTKALEHEQPATMYQFISFSKVEIMNRLAQREAAPDVLDVYPRAGLLVFFQAFLMAAPLLESYSSLICPPSCPRA
jgi:hypothetical protein